MDLLKPFLQVISAYGLADRPVVLAVSGGVDSVVLCELSQQAGLQFAIAHCNFNLRGEESERDETFVKSLAGKYGVEVLVKKFDTTSYAAANKLSVQEAARNLRYNWFEELHKQHGFAYTLLAHHANDNIETLLMNFFRGTGLDGLTGMPQIKKEAHCLRPMLAIKRSDIEQFAKEHGLQWVEDSSNAANKYSRNYFRNVLIPGLQEVYPQVEDNLLNNIRRFKDATELQQQLMKAEMKKLVELKGEELHIPVLKLMKYNNRSLIYAIIHFYGFGEKAVEEVIKLADAPSGKYVANKEYRIIRHRKWFIISPIAKTANTFIIEKEDDRIFFQEEQMEIKRLPIEKFSLEKSQTIAQLDAGTLVYPLLLRKWKSGDYFYPLGMQKKKKLARFFIDQKLSKTAKEKIWVVESGKRIVWIVGHRIDDRFKITAHTKEVVQFSLSSL